jgi:serine/threonine protein kinase
VKFGHEALGREPELLDRVRLEAQSLGRLYHPNVVEVTDFPTASDARCPFVVMEYLRGRKLAQGLRRRDSLAVIAASRTVGSCCRLSVPRTRSASSTEMSNLPTLSDDVRGQSCTT